jgi:gluconate 2-dehydrogenase gamma chain
MSISRRAFTSGFALIPLAGAALAAPHEQHVTDVSSPNAFDAARWQAQVFDEHQLETVAAVAEVIIPRTDTPGARDACVHLHLDHIFSDSPRIETVAFLEGLWWLDGYCLRKEAKPFKDLEFQTQTKLLAELHESSEADVAPGTAFVHLAKKWTARIYYATKSGQEELNKGGRVPSRYASSCNA